MTLNIPALTNNLADNALAKIIEHFKCIRTPEPSNPPIMTRESVCERPDLRLAILATPAFVVEEITEGSPTIPTYACRCITAAREHVLNRVVSYEGRVPHKARQALLDHGSITKDDMTLTIRASTIGALIDALPSQYAEAVERQRVRMASDDWYKYL
jgi:hypothetical protein